MADRVNLSSHHSISLSPDSQVPDVGIVLLIAIPITGPWICWQLGVKCVFVATRSPYRKPTLSTNIVARRQRDGFSVLWTKLKRSGSPRSVEKRKQCKAQLRKTQRSEMKLSNKNQMTFHSCCNMR